MPQKVKSSEIKLGEAWTSSLLIKIQIFFTNSSVSSIEANKIHVHITQMKAILINMSLTHPKQHSPTSSIQWTFMRHKCYWKMLIGKFLSSESANVLSIVVDSIVTTSSSTFSLTLKNLISIYLTPHVFNALNVIGKWYSCRIIKKKKKIASASVWHKSLN